MRVLMMATQKGGAGKTTTAMGLASVAAETGRVLLVDLDAGQRTATWWAEQVGDSLPFDVAETRDPAALGGLRQLEYDMVIVDTPGSLDARPVLTAALEQSDYVVLPAEPSAVDLQPLARTVRELVRPAGVPHRALLTKVDPRSPADMEMARSFLEGQGIPVFQQTVRRYAAHRRAALLGQVPTQYGTDGQAAAEDYRRVTTELFAEWSGHGVQRRAQTGAL